MQYAERKTAKEAELAALREASFRNRQAADEASLEVDIQREAFAQRILAIEAKIALARATASGDQSAITLAQEQVGLAEALGASLEEEAQLRRDALEVQQAANREQFNAEESQKKFNTQLELADARFKALTGQASGVKPAIDSATNSTKDLAKEANSAASAFERMQRSATGIGGTKQQFASAADGIVGSEGGRSFAQAEALAAAQGITNEYEKQAFLLKARAKELEKAGLFSTEKVNIGGASLDLKEAASLFSGAASSNADVARLAQTTLGSAIAQAQVGQTVGGATLDEILKNIQALQRDRLVGFASGTRGKPFLGTAVVGEQGFEVIEATPQGVHVLSNPESSKFLGGTKLKSGIRAFAKGTGSLSDFVSAAEIETKSRLLAFGKEIGKSRPQGLSYDQYLEISKAQGAIRASEKVFPEISKALSASAFETAKALAGDFARTVGGKSFSGDLEKVINAVAGFANLKVPSFAGGISKFEGGLAYVHQGELLANLPRGTDVIPNNALRSGNQQSAGTSVSTKIENLTIQHPDPTGEAVRFLHENARQDLRMARL